MLRPILESWGMVVVNPYMHSGNDHYCHRRIVQVNFDNSLTGDVPSFIMNTSNLVFDNSNKWKEGWIHTWRTGGIRVHAAGGDW